MKTKEKKELKLKTKKELETLLKEARSSLLSLRFQHAQSKLKEKRSIFMTRKKIAQIMTFMNERGNSDEKN
ncbi:MAG: 50S ribosomal protein L29 [Patescibacteria group bacterium]|nr:50S ribosomal protein L29 [Patescibacteria group bacterium]